MIPVTAGQVAAITGGYLQHLDPDTLATSATIDSRQVTPGAIFVAVPGTRVDGADYVAAATEAGAVFGLTQRPVEAPAVVCQDVLAALAALAKDNLARRRHLETDIKVVAVTGSAGKTTTKDLLAGLCRHLGSTVAARGSFNNHLGLPLTVLAADQTTEFLVLEMGANHLGEIAGLAKVAPPDLAVELGVGVAHLGEFGSREAIAKAKAELVQALAPTGLAILNFDEPLTKAMASQTKGQVTGFGTDLEAQVRSTKVWTDQAGRVGLEVSWPGASHRFETELVGRHHATNLLAAAATGWALGLTPSEIAASLAGVGPGSPHRMAVVELSSGWRLIDDSYNANPPSVTAALQAASAMGEATGRPVWAVLGPMGELGPEANQLHREVGLRAAELGLERLIAVGQAAKGYLDGGADGAMRPEALEFCPSLDQVVAALDQPAAKEPIILIKGSNAAQLWRLVDLLVKAEGTA